MIRSLLISLLALGALAARAETLQVTDLDVSRVVVMGSAEVEITQDDASLLQVRGDQDDLDKRPFYVRGDTLVLGASETHKRDNFSSLKYRLSLPDLEQLTLNGSGDVYVRPLQAGSLEVGLAGSGDIKLFSVTADDVDLTIEGSGDIQVAELVAPLLELLVAGSGDIAIGELDGDVVDATVSGSGDISLKRSSLAGFQL